jgi:D-ribose pyranose/furanose isomerase RbsD
MPSNPNDGSCLHIGALKYDSLSLKQEKLRFINILNNLIKTAIVEKTNMGKESKKKNHHTPTWLLENAKESCIRFNK